MRGRGPDDFLAAAERVLERLLPDDVVHATRGKRRAIGEMDGIAEPERAVDGHLAIPLLDAEAGEIRGDDALARQALPARRIPVVALELERRRRDEQAVGRKLPRSVTQNGDSGISSAYGRYAFAVRPEIEVISAVHRLRIRAPHHVVRAANARRARRRAPCDRRGQRSTRPRRRADPSRRPHGAGGDRQQQQRHEGQQIAGDGDRVVAPLRPGREDGERTSARRRARRCALPAARGSRRVRPSAASARHAAPRRRAACPATRARRRRACRRSGCPPRLSDQRRRWASSGGNISTARPRRWQAPVPRDGAAVAGGRSGTRRNPNMAHDERRQHERPDDRVQPGRERRRVAYRTPARAPRPKTEHRKRRKAACAIQQSSRVMAYGRAIRL